ncbi:hypothetical protein MAR_029742 [Mya arenaria]|uniref:Caspase family p20 domain-containing protein n=1 Tax=Mya arenaria TaxID=6604 RepID=A0ABY7DK22_MYAAR|nr:hypothetical protein MAR_029742 [Mya arenaria]
MAYELGSGSVRGYAVLLAYEKFNNGANRTGGDKDLVNMKKIARDMRLEQINQGENNEKNLTKHQTLKVLEDARGILSQKNDCQMFVFIISTHGKELPNPSARGQKDHALSCSDDVDPTWYMVKGTELMNPDGRMLMSKDKTRISVVRNIGAGSQTSADSETMETGTKDETEADARGGGDSKPMQATPATRETEDDASRTMPPEPTHFPIQVSEGTETNTKHLPIQESGNGSHAQQTVAVTNSPQTVPIIPPYNPHDRWGHGNKTYIKDPMPRGVKCNRDTLIMSAVPSGMMAWRDTENGSWLIACVKEALENEKQKKEMVNFMSVLTTVTSMMAGMETNTKHNNPAVHQMKAVPVIEHQLLKKLSV